MDYRLGSDDALARLQEGMRACRRCLEAGYTIAPGPVFRGNIDSEVMLIGQAPGVTEAEVKRPFNAGSGRRLFQWLGQAGWDEELFRQRHYMTAVTKCYPGRSANGKGDRVASKIEQDLCRPFLEQEIALVRPRLLILVGGLAIRLMYPASARLNDIIGTAAYFPPQALADPVNFNLASARRFTADELHNLPTLLTHLPPDGRWVVPLPHPSGASLWPNKPENQALIARALAILRDIRLGLDL